jgi:hypothetical protein
MQCTPEAGLWMLTTTHFSNVEKGRTLDTVKRTKLQKHLNHLVASTNNVLAPV